MKNLWSNICWSSTTFHHYFVRHHNLGQAEICHFNLYDLFSPWILLNKNVFWFEISVDNSAGLKVLNGLDYLIHDERYLPLFKFIALNVFKELSTCSLFHNDVHILLRFICLSHLDNVCMRYQFDNLNLLSQKFFLSFS